MAKEFTPEQVKEAMASFYNGPVKVYEAGRDEDRPERIQDRPFFSLFPSGATYYLESGEQGADYSVAQKPKSEGKLDTQHSQFIQDMEKRFRNVKDNATIVVVDPDVIRSRYVMDERAGKSITHTLAEYLQQRLAENGKQKDFQLSAEDAQVLKQASMDGNDPLSASEATGRSMANPYGDGGQVSIVIASQPDKPMHYMFSRVPGVRETMKTKGPNGQPGRKMILFYEPGHSLGLTQKGLAGVAPATRMLHDRHRTENKADAHAVLQLARDEGNTDMGELVGDLRAQSTMRSTLKMMQQFRMKGPDLSGQDDEAGKKGKGDGKDGNGSANLGGFLPGREGDFKGGPMIFRFNAEQEGMKAMMAGEGFDPQAERAKDAAKTPQGQVLQGLESNAMAFEAYAKFGMIGAYNTTPTVDAAVKYAKGKLKDGSLQKMTDKQIHDAADKLAEKNGWSQEKMDAYAYAAMTGQNGEEVQAVIKRGEKALDNLPGLREEVEKSKNASPMDELKKMLTQQMQKQGPTPEQQEELIRWRREMIESINKEGGDKNAILDVAGKEKDNLRDKIADPVNQYKMKLLNQEFLGIPEESARKAQVYGVVKNAVQKTEVPEVDKKGDALVASYVKNEISALDVARKGVKQASKRDVANQDVDEYTKALGREKRTYKKLLSAEHATQAAAFALRKDKEAWKKVQETPDLAARIEKRAKQKHPEWLEEYHLNIGENTPYRGRMIDRVLEKDTQMLAHSVNKNKSVMLALEREDEKTAGAIRKNAPQPKRKQSRVGKAAQEEPRPKGTVWHRSGSSRG